MHETAVLSASGNQPKVFFGPHHPLLVNDNIILFETLLKTGQSLPMHSHPRPHLRYTFSPGVQKHTWKDQSTTIQVDQVGAYEWRDTLEHEVENVGDADIHSLVFELRRVEEDPDTLFLQGHELWSQDEFQSATMHIDNHRLRVLDLTLRKNEKSQSDDKRHAPTIFYAFEAWKARIVIHPNCEFEASLPKGQALWFSGGLRSFMSSGEEDTRLCVISLNGRKP